MAFSILTDNGLAAFAAAQVAESFVDLTHLAVGDGGGADINPVSTMTALVNETWRGSLNRIYVSTANPNYLVIEAQIPTSEGGFDIREVGVFDNAGTLIGVGSYPLTNKPAPGSGSEKDLYVRLILEVSNATNVVQSIDPTLVYLTQWHLDEHANRTDDPHNTLIPHLAAVDPHPQYETSAEVQAKVNTAISTLMNAPPSTLDTLNELAAALGDDPNFATTMANALATKETPAGAQAKVDAHKNVAAPHSGHETPAGAQAKVNAAINALMNTPPSSLDTLNELAAALGDDPNFATTITNLIATKETPAGAQAKVDEHSGRSDNPHNVLAGQISGSVSKVDWFASSVAPTGWLKCNGAAISRTTYAALFAAIGTTFGDGNGVSTFNLPDLRGEFVRGWDDGRGVDSGRLLGSWEKGTLLGWNTGLDTSVYAAQLTAALVGQTEIGADDFSTGDYPNISLASSSGTGSVGLKGSATSAYSGTARPRNVALLACIRY